MTNPSNHRSLSNKTALRDDAELAAAMDAYLQELETGKEIAPAEFASRFPKIADELQSCLKSLDFMHQTGRTLLDNRELATGQNDPFAVLSLGDFRLLREIGRGGMGVVYEAEQLSLGRRVAVKVLPFAALLDQRQLERFKNEARAAAMLKHPNIVSVYSVGCERSVHFYAMELVEGKSLAELINGLTSEHELLSAQDNSHHSSSKTDKSPASLDTVETLSTDYSTNRKSFYRGVTRLGIQAAEALSYAHQHDVIHRDIKPSNLLIDQQGHIHVADFGLARIRAGDELTMSGDVVGTIRYMSPEQLEGHFVDERTDVYSLGVTLYELTVGRSPFAAEQREKLIQQVLDASPPPPSKFDSNIPRDLETIILKSIARDPSSRYASAGEVANDLQSFLQNKPIKARRVSNLEKSRRWVARNRVVSCLAATVALLLVAFGIGSSIISWKLRVESQAKEAGLYARDMRLVQQAINEASIVEAEQTLLKWVPSKGQEDHRGFEWYYLWRACHDPAIIKTLAHPFKINEVAFVGQNDMLAVGWFSKRVQVWNLEDQAATKPKLELHGTSIGERCFATIPNTNHLIVGVDGNLSEWDVTNGSCLRTVDLELTTSAGIVNSIDVSGDGKYLAIGVGTEHGLVQVWDWKNRSKIFCSGPELTKPKVKFGPTGELITVSKQPAILRTYDIQDDSQSVERKLSADECFSMAISPDRSQLIVGVHDVQSDRLVSRIDVWETESWKRTKSLYLGSTGINEICYSPDGLNVLAGNEDGTLFCIRTLDWNVLKTKTAHAGEIMDLSFSSNSSQFASASTDGDIHVWDLKKFLNSDSLLLNCAHNSYLGELDFLDNQTVVSADPLGVVYKWNFTSGAPQKYFEAKFSDSSANYNQLAVSPDRQFIAVTRGHWPPNRDNVRAGKVVVFDVASDSVHCEYVVQSGIASSMSSFSHDSRFLAICSGNSAIVFDLQHEKLLHKFSAGKTVKGTAFSPDGKWFAFSSADGMTHLYEAPEFRKKRTVQTDDYLSDSVNFSPDSTMFAVTGFERRIRLFDTSTGQAIDPVRFKQIPDFMVYAKFSPDGTRLMSGDWGGKIRVWDVESGEELLTFTGEKGATPTGGFSPGGSTLAAASEENLFVFRTADRANLEYLSIAELTDLACQNLLEYSNANYLAEKNAGK